ncbi:hypothetical protein BIW11_07517, partial [Tropilaelaps mercedesae]
MDSLPRFHRWGSSVGLSEKSRHKWSSASNITRQSHAGSAYQLELEQLIDTFRRSVLLATDSPLSPPSPRPLNGLLHHSSMHHGIHHPYGGNQHISQRPTTMTSTVTAMTNSSFNSAPHDPLHGSLQSAFNPIDHQLNPLTASGYENQVSLSHTPHHYASIDTRGHLGQQQMLQRQQHQQHLQSLANQQQIQQITEQIAMGMATIQHNHENNLHAREPLIYCKNSSSEGFTM